METVGSLIDKLSINELKIYHMKEQLDREDVSVEFKDDCKNRLAILSTQRSDLESELQELLDDVLSGRKKLRLYRQMKMYNEKKFKD